MARETTEETRAKGFSIFYMMVNIGAFSGKTIVQPPSRVDGRFGTYQPQLFRRSFNSFKFPLLPSSYSSKIASALKLKIYEEIETALLHVLKNGRLIVLILIITGF